MAYSVSWPCYCQDEINQCHVQVQGSIQVTRSRGHVGTRASVSCFRLRDSDSCKPRGRKTYTTTNQWDTSHHITYMKYMDAAVYMLITVKRNWNRRANGQRSVPELWDDKRDPDLILDPLEFIILISSWSRVRYATPQIKTYTPSNAYGPWNILWIL